MKKKSLKLTQIKLEHGNSKKRNIKVDVVNFDSDLDLCKIKKKIEFNINNDDLILTMGAGTISKLPQYLKIIGNNMHYHL